MDLARLRSSRACAQAEVRDEYQRSTQDEDAADTIASMDHRVSDMMRLAVEAVRVAGASAHSTRVTRAPTACRGAERTYRD